MVSPRSAFYRELVYTKYNYAIVSLSEVGLPVVLVLGSFLAGTGLQASQSPQLANARPTVSAQQQFFK